jgi:hypothetical protein
VLNEEFFDLHPQPWDVEKHCILETTSFRISLYLDVQNPDTFLVEILYQDWQSCKYKEAMLGKVLENSDVDVYRIRKKLFLRRLLF